MDIRQHKFGIESSLTTIKNEVESGELSALEALGHLKMIAKYADAIVKWVEPMAMEEAINHPEKSFSDYGMKFEKRSGGVLYNFKHIEEWQQAKQHLAQIEQKYRGAYEAKLKGQSVVDNDTGEIIEELPKISYRKDSLTVKQ